MAEVGRNRSPSLINFGALLHRLNTTNKSLVRNLEKMYKKQVQVFYGLIFNRTCLLENILHKYTNIYIYIYIITYRIKPQTPQKNSFIAMLQGEGSSDMMD